MHLGGDTLLIPGVGGIVGLEITNSDGPDEQRENQQNSTQHQGTMQTVTGLRWDRLTQTLTARLVRALRDRTGGPSQPPAADMDPPEARAPAVSTTVGAGDLSRARPEGVSGSRSDLL